jgi:prolyl-tRNA editing enzyme YbaK/EbsC (Cys-tRNA(Pro) deacylase)
VLGGHIRLSGRLRRRSWARFALARPQLIIIGSRAERGHAAEPAAHSFPRPKPELSWTRPPLPSPRARSRCSRLPTASGSRTAGEAAAACGCDVAQIVKSLVFAGKASGAPYLLLVSGKNRVDEKAVAAVIGEALTRPDAQKVREWTGFAIGGVPPFGHATILPTFVDEELLRHDLVWAAAGTPSALFSVAPKALAQAVGGKVVRVT